jgi:uncharacterized repeat protein (TIGR01451 family)
MKRRNFCALILIVGLLGSLLAAFITLSPAAPAQAASTGIEKDRPGRTFEPGGVLAIPAGPRLEPPPGLPPALPPDRPLQDTPVLTITKSVDPGTAYAGDVLTYTIEVMNGGTAVTETVVTDALDASVSFARASDDGDFDAGARMVTWDVGDLGAGQKITRSLWVTVSDVTSGTLIGNTAGVRASQGASDLDSISTPVHTSADLAIEKSGAAGSVVAGTSFTYTITLTNQGPSTASSVVISDTLPAGVTFKPTGSSPGCSAAGQVVTCAVESLAAEDHRTHILAVDVDASLPDGTLLNNAARVSGADPDPAPGNNVAEEQTTVETEADLSLSKTDLTDPIHVLTTPARYTLAVTNHGPSDARNVVLTDTLPLNADLVEVIPNNADCTSTPDTVTCRWDNIADGDTQSVVIRVLANAPGRLVNEAEVTSDETDPDTGNNRDIEDTTVQPANLSLTKTDGPDPVLVNGTLTYTLTVFNIGPNAAEDVLLTDTLPSGVAFVSATPVYTHSGGVVTWSRVTLNPGVGITRRVVVRPTTSGQIANRAEVSALQPDPQLANNVVTATTRVDPVIDLAVAKSASSATVIAGTSFTYTLTVSNAGPSGATGAVATDTLPSGVSFGGNVPGQNCSAQGQDVVCDVGDLGAEEAVHLALPVLASQSLAHVVVLQNTAWVAGNEFDAQAGNDSDSLGTTIHRRADLQVQMTGPATPVIAGTSFSYSLLVTNHGPSDASNVKVTDPLPAGLSFKTAGSSAGCTSASGTVTCQVANLAGGAATPFTIAVTANAGVAHGSPIENSVTVSASETDPESGNNTAEVETIINRQVDLEIEKQDMADPVSPGAALAYRITVTNHGPSNASAVVVNDPLPSEVTFAPSASSSNCSLVSGNVRCSIGNLAAGSDTTLTIAVDVAAALADGTSISNMASVSGNEAEAQPGNNSAAQDTQVTENRTFLPLVLRPPLTELSVLNDNTGDEVTFTVLGAGIICVVPNGELKFCGRFAPGTYNVEVKSRCGDSVFSRTYEAGPVMTRVFCR